MSILTKVFTILGPQESPYTPRDGNYRYSYESPEGVPQFFTKESMTSQAHADSEANAEMAKLVARNLARPRSLRRA